MMDVFVKGLDADNTVTALLTTVGVCCCAVPKGSGCFVLLGNRNPVLGFLACSLLPQNWNSNRVHLILVFSGEG